MEAIYKNRPDLLGGNFEQPSNVGVFRIDSKRGCMIERGGIGEFFIQGNEPLPCSNQKQSRKQSVRIKARTNLILTLLVLLKFATLSQIHQYQNLQRLFERRRGLRLLRRV